MKKAFLLTLCLLSPLFLSACQQGGGDPAKRSDGAKEMIVDPRIPSGKVYEFDEVDPREKGEVRSLSSASDLLLFQQKVNQADPDYVNGYFQLESDISLTDEWIPISGFKGQLNGQGHAIRGISIEGDKNKKGFFSSLDGAKIGCITFEGHVAAGDTASLVAGYTLGDCSFVGVTVEGTMDVSNNAGGLIGTLAGGSVKAVGCINHAIIRGGSYLGGLIGANKSYKVNISDSANCASVLGDGSTIGGIIGSLTHSISQTNDYSLVDCFNYGLVKGRSYAGGVVGLSSARLIRCGAGKDAKVYAVSDNGETEATTLTSFASPYCSVLSGHLLYNTAINEYGELIGCENQFGFAVTGINDPAGCTRIIPYKDKIMLFAATNKYAISEDGGATFGPFRTVSDKSTEICPIDGEKSTDTGNTQPWVLADGRIIMMYRAIRVSTSFSYASLRMRISDENGEFDSSDEPIMLIENFTENTGKAGAFYEPYPIVLDDGSLAVYISEDVHYSAPFDNGSYRIPKLKDDLICDGGSQDTVMIPLRIAPGATEVGPGKIEVGEPQLIFQGSNLAMFGHSNSRPGMTVVTQLYDGSYAMILENSTEMNNPGYNLVVQITYSRDGLTWTPPRTIIRPHREGGASNGIGKQYKTCAPFITTLPDGRIVAVCATDEDYEGYYPNDDAHYKHEIAFVSRGRVSYDQDLERDRDFIQLGNYVYSENEYCVWASVAQIDGWIYVSGLQGVNYLKKDGTLASPTDWVLISRIHYLSLYERLGLSPLS